MEAAIEAIREKAAALPEENKPRVLMLLDLDSLYVAGAGTLEDELIAAAGGINMVDEEQYAQLSEEALIEGNPDIIVCTFPEREDSFGKRGMENLNAVMNEAIYDPMGICSTARRAWPRGWSCFTGYLSAIKGGERSGVRGKRLFAVNINFAAVVAVGIGAVAVPPRRWQNHRGFCGTIPAPTRGDDHLAGSPPRILLGFHRCFTLAGTPQVSTNPWPTLYYRCIQWRRRGATAALLLIPSILGLYHPGFAGALLALFIVINWAA